MLHIFYQVERRGNVKKAKWGILGTARIAVDQLIPAIKKASNADIVAISTQSNTDRAKAICDQFGIQTIHDSYESLLDDPMIDVVYIPLPNHLHKESTIKAAQKGKHILCEKPAGLTSEEIAEMKRACRENNVLFMEAFMYYFHPQHERVKDIIDSGEIGNVLLMEAGFSFLLEEKERETDIRMNRNLGGGAIYDLGCYAIHAIRNILRNEPESIFVHGSVDPKFNVDTDAFAYLTFADDVRATFNVSFNTLMRHEYRIHGSKGTITVPRAFRPDLNGGEALIKVEKDSVTRVESIQGDQYCNEVVHLSQAVLEGKNVQHGFENTFNNLKVIEAGLESLRTSKEIKL